MASEPVSQTKPSRSTSGMGGTAPVKEGLKPNPFSKDWANWRARTLARPRPTLKGAATFTGSGGGRRSDLAPLSPPSAAFFTRMESPA